MTSNRLHRPAHEQARCPRPDGTSKVGYRSAAKARQAITTQRGRAGLPLFAYECRRCGLWHLTSMSPPKRGAS